MIDLPDHGYTSRSIKMNDAGGVVQGSLGGPDDIIARPGLRYSIQFTTPMLNMNDARKFEALLEQCARDDGSYLWPLDFRPPPASAPGNSPHVNGSSPAGSVIGTITGLSPGYPVRLGQPVAVLSGGVGYVHRASSAQIADGTGTFNPLAVFPWTRVTFNDGDVVEIEKPRIRGLVSYEGSSQGSFGRRAFTFVISERL